MAAPELNDSNIASGIIGGVLASIPWIGQWLIKKLDVNASSSDALRDDLRAERDAHKADADRWRSEAEKERHDRLALELKLNEALIQMGNLTAELAAEKRARIAAEERITKLEQRLARLEGKNGG